MIYNVSERRRPPVKRNIKAFVYPDGDGFVAESSDVNVVTQGDTLEETLANLREAVGLALDGEDLAEWDLAPNPTLVVKASKGSA